MLAMETSDTNALFEAWRSGDHRARAQLFDRVYPEMHRLAGQLLRRERQVSLSAGDLIHESAMRLIRTREIAFEDRAHFMAVASRCMRRVLVDHVRAKQAEKRDHHKVALTTSFERSRPVDLSGLDSALIRLTSLDGQSAEIVEMRYFGGMSLGDIAEVLSLSEATVKRRWLAARAWLLDALENPLVALQRDA
jgi:RNA polymerase sigma factor (TIGR02999 family)